MCADSDRQTSPPPPRNTGRSPTTWGQLFCFLGFMQEEQLYTPQRPADGEIGTWSFDFAGTRLSEQRVVKCPKCEKACLFGMKFHCSSCGFHKVFPPLLHETFFNHWPEDDQALWKQLKCAAQHVFFNFSSISFLLGSPNLKCKTLVFACLPSFALT